jgi:hypothetical protein
MTDQKQVMVAERLGKLCDLVVERGKTHGDMQKSFDCAAALWTLQYADKLKPGVVISAEDVAMSMGLLKVSRRLNGAKHSRDHMDDAAAYFVMSDELREPTPPGGAGGSGFPIGSTQIGARKV